jgi:hypothetical protein
MGKGVGAQRPVWHGNAPKTTGARSARARTRGQNPLVTKHLPEVRAQNLELDGDGAEGEADRWQPALLFKPPWQKSVKYRKKIKSVLLHNGGS